MEIDFKDYVKEDNFLNLRSNKEILEHDNLEELGSFLRNNPGITKLSLENCDIDSSNIKRLIAPIKESNISNLDISCNKLGAVGAAEIANELSNLTILNISCNKLGAVGAAEIANKLSNLTDLNIGFNELGDVGAAEIANKLSNLTDPKLSKLDIAGNELGDEGVKAIADSLSKLTDLTYLNMFYNKLGYVVTRL